jgi:hypothetical protein
VLGPWTLLVLGVRRANDRLDFIAVDETGDVGVGDLGSGKTNEGLVAISWIHSFTHM